MNMDLLEDPSFQAKYKKSKYRVKRWESDFMEKYGRKPNKNDIRAADNTIKESYKMYWKLKTQALEETLLDITFSDEAQANVTANISTNASMSAETLATDLNKSSSSANDSKASPESLTKNSENIDPEKAEKVAIPKGEFVASLPKDETPNVDGAWGEHLNKDKEVVQLPKKKTISIGRSPSFQLSQKMFSSSNLTKRNPRKSLSMNKLKNTKSEHTSNESPTAASTEKFDGFDIDSSKPLFGEAVKIVHAEAKISTQSINTIQQLIKGGSTIANRQINQGWLDRCSRENGLEPITHIRKRLSGTSDSGAESMDLSDPSPLDNLPTPVPQKTADVSDDEDYVCNSDSEEERRNKRVRNFNKVLSHEACQQIAKRQRIDVGDHFSFSQPLPNKITIGLTPPIMREQIPQEISQDDRRADKSEEPARTVDIPAERFAVTEKEMSSNRTQNAVSTLEKVALQPQSERQIELEAEAEIAEMKKNVRKPRVPDTYFKPEDEEQRELELNEKTTEKKARRVRKPRVTRRKVTTDINFDEEEEEEEEEEELDSDEEITPVKKKSARKTTRAPRTTKGKAKSVGTGETANGRKLRAGSGRKGVPRKKVQKVEEEPLEEEITEETSEGKKIPIYGVDSIDVVPRFALPTNASGDLVSDFSKSIAPLGIQEVAGSAKPKGPLTDREKLEKKMASGKMNDNFVRVNLKKKVFVRGKKNFNFSRYRKNQWKQMKKELSSSEAALDLADLAEKSGGACFKCGGTGHFARRCPAMKSDELLPDDGVEVSEYPTLEEAEKMAAESKLVAHSSRIDRLPECPSFAQSKDAKPVENIGEADEEEDYEDEDAYSEFFDDEFDQVPLEAQPEVSVKKLQGHKIPEELLAKLLPPENGAVDPVYAGSSELPETPAEVFEALRMFGHENFRPGQQKAVMRILSGQSTLVTLSTGSGKSLCYQLPAYIYAKRSRCITLVVSPLVSLMDDQVVGVPKFLSAAALHTGQSAKVKEKIMETIKEGKLDILLVSPEAVVAGEKSTGFGSLLRQLPPIAFACIDEAHCISQWSHNFRPSYLMICRVLIEKMGIKTILGLTATATKSTAESIVKHLNIRDGLAGVISDTPMPKNLTLTVSKDEQRDRALIDLLLSERFKECDSIIVYCTRREECTRIAGIIRISLQDPKKRETAKAKCSEIAEAYHAGLAASRRKVIQKSFMSGQTRIVVATVAFGMGINKTNIRSVIHYNMPASFEGYVQEVGRAGRDYLPAHCHLFLAPSRDGDKLELRRHIFADGVDRHMIRRLLQKIFVPCSCPRVGSRNNAQRCPGHEVAIPIDETVRALDITEETILTLLCYLELHPRRYVTVLSSVYVNAKVSSYGGAKALKAAAQSSPPLAMAIALDLKRGISHDNSCMIEFPVVDVAAAIGWDSGVVKSHLKNLEWQTVEDKSKRSAISVRYDTLGLRVRAPGDLTDTELDEALEALAGRAREQESSALRQLDAIHAALSKYSVRSVMQCTQLTEEISSKSESLKEIIREYFRSDEPLSVVEIPPQADPTNEAEIASDVRTLVSSYRDNNFTGRAVARIFHGIQSPNYSALAWSRCRFWRSHLATDFNFICRIATREILAMR